MHNSYAIAWQSLAAAVMQGKKEHALGIYRLLSRSFEHKALVDHLQGDIFLAFNDIQNACNAYTQAALLYEQQGDVQCAQRITEHVQLLQDI